MNYYSRNNRQNGNKQTNTANFPSQGTQQAPANFPSQGTQQAPANFPSQGTQQAPANFPSQGTQQPPANFPSQGTQQAPANFPSQGTQQAPANFPSQGTGQPPQRPAVTRPTTGQATVNGRPAQNTFKPPAGQIQIEKSKGNLQTVTTTPATGSVADAGTCTDCSPDAGSILTNVLTEVIGGVPGIAEQIAEVITVPAAVSGGKTDAVTLPASVAQLPTVGTTTLPAPAPDYKNCLSNFPVGMCYVPMQKWETPYKENIGFEAGTIFPSLDLKFNAEKGCAVK
ncbi:MAG: spore coat associated protein CotJA [Ruminococcus sp.]|jgi:hypothetical protein|nr:spore coat associated protein CotJA [Ruminococcus sp.]